MRIDIQESHTCGGCLHPWFMAHCNSTPYSSTLVHCVSSLYVNPCLQTAMYTVIYQCCPNRCLAICSSTVVTRLRLYLLYCSLYSFSFTCLGYTQRQSLALSFAHITCSLPICSIHFNRHNILFFSKLFHIGFTSKPATKNKKSCWTQTRSEQRSIFVCFVPVNIRSFLLSSRGSFPFPCFLLGTIPCICLGFLFLCFLTKHVSF